MTETSITADPFSGDVEALGFTIRAVFVPFSKSRNAGNDHLSLNWLVTVVYKGRDIITNDFSAGCAYCPSYNTKPPALWSRPAKNWQRYATSWECENGFKAKFVRWGDSSVNFVADRRPATVAEKNKLGVATMPAEILPSVNDVVYSLAMDASVLDSGGFEEWANEFGYDVDSRKAEATYRACLEAALKLRAGIGEALLQQLREASHDR